MSRILKHIQKTIQIKRKTLEKFWGDLKRLGGRITSFEMKSVSDDVTGKNESTHGVMIESHISKVTVRKF